jgi:aminoglycoside phosphotransferase (APT) family kinase protein
MPGMLNVDPLIRTIFREEAGLPAEIDRLEFVQRHHTDVYRVRTAAGEYIAQVAPDGTEYLRRLCHNLRQLESLDDRRIPWVHAFRESIVAPQSESGWSLLITKALEGTELSPSTHSREAWVDLCDVLHRVHGLSATPQSTSDFNFPVHSVGAFSGFAETLLLHLGGLPLDGGRVRGHLDEMAVYVAEHADGFRVPGRLIHGDLNRSNVLVQNGRIGLIDWFDLGAGDYAFDLAMLKFMMDSVAPRLSSGLLREQVEDYSRRFDDQTLEMRMRFFLALPGLVHALWYASRSSLFPAARAWRVRTCYLHSETQWRSPLRLNPAGGAPAVRTEHWALRFPQPVRGMFYLLAPKRLT